MQKITFKALIVFLFCGLFTDVLAQSVAYRDIIISEIYIRTTPSLGLPERQFVEIFNRSETAINLDGWTIKDATTSAGILPNITLLPGEYGIICRSTFTAEFSGFGKVIPATTLATLNQTGDSVILRNNTGVIVDALYYTDAWYKDPSKSSGGYTLELINPELNCSDARNWAASNAAIGGTPGQTNSILNLTPDTIAPVLTTLSVISPSQIQLTFSKGMDAVIAANPNLYVFEPSISISSVSLNASVTVATITLATPIENGIIYQLSLIGLSDCEGNALPATTRSIAIGKAPSFNELIITEIMSDPSPVVQLPDQEYIEIYNASQEVIDLKGVVFSSSSRSTVISDGILFPGEYAVVVSSTAVSDFSFAPKVIGVSSFPSLTNSGASISLDNALGNPVFQITYSDTWFTSTFKRDGGWSLEMIDTKFPCAGRENWAASTDGKGGTPAVVNSVAGNLSDDVAPSGVAVEISAPNRLRILFSEKINPEELFKAVITLNPNIEITSVLPDLPVVNSITLELVSELQADQVYQINIAGIEDCAGNILSQQTLSFGLPELPEAGDIIINELLFDPKTGGEDFVELWNVSDKILSLADMQIVREDANFEIVTLTSLSSTPRLILPGEYMVLSAKGETVRAQYQTPGPGVFTDVSGFPSYVNEGGVVALYRQDLEVLDRFPYDDKLHYSLLDETKGVSLERINPDKPTAERKNWNSAALSIGGATPGFKNSNFLVPNVQGSLNVSPEVFSPDQDGIDDLLSIAFSLEKPGYLGSVSIYTVEGVPVKKLVSNETLAQEGFFIWNGLDDEDKKARTGIYVVFLEVFDLDGNKNVFRAKCVLASRLK